MSPIISKADRFIRILILRFITDGCGYQAAALSYTSVLSLVPLMTVSFAILSAFPGFKVLTGKIQSYIFQHFIVTSGTMLETYVQKTISQAPKLPGIGIIFLIFTAVVLMYNMERAFNAIWHVNVKRSGIASFILYWAILTLAPLLLGVSFIVTSYLFSLPFISALVVHTSIAKLGLTVLPFIMTTVAFAIFYIAIPNCPVPFRYGFIAALVAAILFELAKFGFGFYIRHFPFYALLYGALAVIPIFLVWVYISWVIILFGALLSNVLTTGHQYRSEHKLDGFTQAFRWLGYFYQAWQHGKSLSLRELIAQDESDYEVAPEHQLQLLLDAQLIQPVAVDKYVLSKNLSTLTLKDLLTALPWRLPTPEQLSLAKTPWERKLAQITETVTNNTQQDLSLPLADVYAVK